MLLYIYPQAISPLPVPRPVLCVLQVAMCLFVVTIVHRGWFPILKRTKADFCIILVFSDNLPFVGKLFYILLAL